MRYIMYSYGSWLLSSPARTHFFPSTHVFSLSVHTYIHTTCIIIMYLVSYIQSSLKIRWNLSHCLFSNQMVQIWHLFILFVSLKNESTLSKPISVYKRSFRIHIWLKTGLIIIIIIIINCVQRWTMDDSTWWHKSEMMRFQITF